MLDLFLKMIGSFICVLYDFTNFHGAAFAEMDFLRWLAFSLVEVYHNFIWPFFIGLNLAVLNQSIY